MLTCGPWTTLGELRDGAIFETRDGIRAVKSEYTYTNGGQCQCVLLESGEYAHFANGNREIAREILIAEEERELIIAWIERDAETVPADAPLNSYASGYRKACENLANSIRLGMHVPEEQR